MSLRKKQYDDFSRRRFIYSFNKNLWSILWVSDILPEQVESWAEPLMMVISTRRNREGRVTGQEVLRACWVVRKVGLRR